jgi:glycosyltransferase involved in cell wall biosynthesis
VVEDGETGLLVPVRDSEALVQAVVELGEDPERRAAMGKTATERAGRLFDERDVVARVLETYLEVAERKHHDGLAGRLRGRSAQPR